MPREPGYYDDPVRSHSWASWALVLAFVPVAGAAAAVLAGLVLSGPRDLPAVPEQPEDDGAVSRRRAGWATGTR